MKLIDIETGIEYQADRYTYCESVYQVLPTGKRYEKREARAIADESDFWADTVKSKADTHRAICFLEPLEKAEPMPTIEAGDYVTFDYGRSDYVLAGSNCTWQTTAIDSIYRNGKLLWSKS